MSNSIVVNLPLTLADIYALNRRALHEKLVGRSPLESIGGLWRRVDAELEKVGKSGCVEENELVIGFTVLEVAIIARLADPLSDFGSLWNRLRSRLEQPEAAKSKKS